MKHFFVRGGLAVLAMTGFALIAGAKPTPVPAPAPSAQPPGPRYFFNIGLDSRYQIVGLGPVTAIEAQRDNCYCFTPGPEGQTQRIDYLRAGVPNNDPFFLAARIDFETAPGQERRWYRDAHGAPATNLNGVQGEELKLNPAGFPIAVTNLNSGGGHMRDTAGVIRYTRELDAAGRLARGRRSGLLGTDIADRDGYYETRTSYDKLDRPVEYGNFDSSGQPLDNKDGVAIVRTEYVAAGAGTQTIESYFDATGQPVEEKSSGVHQRQTITDARGFVLSETCFDASGAATVDAQTGIHETRDEYDERGNRTSVEFFGSDGQPKNQRVLGYAREQYRYDDHNRVSEKSFTGDDGSPQVLPNLGAAVIRQEYDAEGNIVRRQFFDGQGNPAPHADYGVPAIRIQVKGDTTEVSLRDEKDEPTRNPINGYASFSYKTSGDRPLTRHNLYYDLHGKPMSTFRVFVIKPHLYALQHARGKRRSALGGAAAAGLGALMAMALALRKASYTRRRKVYIPSPLERFLGWLAIFAIVEGTIRFMTTLWWAYVGYQNGRIGWGVYIFEAIVILFFLYRVPRMRVTMRVLNIARDDIDRLIRDYYARAQLKPEFVPEKQAYRTYPFSVRLAYFYNKCHAYLALHWRHRDGRDLARGFAHYLRLQAGSIQAPLRTRALALYYPCVACAYFGLTFLAFYTLWQLIQR